MILRAQGVLRYSYDANKKGPGMGHPTMLESVQEIALSIKSRTFLWICVCLSLLPCPSSELIIPRTPRPPRTGQNLHPEYSREVLSRSHTYHVHSAESRTIERFSRHQHISLSDRSCSVVLCLTAQKGTEGVFDTLNERSYSSKIPLGRPSARETIQRSMNTHLFVIPLPIPLLGSVRRLDHAKKGRIVSAIDDSETRPGDVSHRMNRAEHKETRATQADTVQGRTHR